MDSFSVTQFMPTPFLKHLLCRMESVLLDLSHDLRHLAYLDRLSETAVFAYCQEEGYWTFQYRQEGFSDLKTNGFDPFSNWVVRSPSSDAYDIVYLNTQQWLVKNDMDREPSTRKSVPSSSESLLSSKFLHLQRAAFSILWVLILPKAVRFTDLTELGQVSQSFII
mmetsp:Transcript_23951/g.66478  ORF Transcript_23951/g.66478 Transcript_23951/m.66478 type:complete len:166 (-) Transcript_23951:1-498(-)